MKDARETALNCLLSLRHGAWSDAALDAWIRRDGLDRRDAALCSALCYGVLQNRLLLDWHIAAYSSLKPQKIAPTVQEILRLGAYQLLFLDKIPPSAAVNEAVALCRRLANPRAAAFVNAVLRKIAQNARATPPLPENPLARLSVLYSHPLPLVELLAAELGPEQTEAFLRSNNIPAPLSLRLNTLKGEPKAILARMEAEALRPRPHFHLPEAAEMDGAGDLRELPVFREGLFTVQDTAAQYCVRALDPRPGQTVLDVCAAPGGKSFAAAALMENRGRLIACDVHEAKLPRMAAEGHRLGVSILETVCADATVEKTAFLGLADRVLADVPCSGLGVIRKKPEIRYKDLSDMAALPALQKKILENASRYVKSGGIVVYSTCTILERENQAVARAFLQNHPEFRPVPFSLPGLDAPEGMCTLWPQTQGTDGFFIAKFQRG